MCREVSFVLKDDILSALKESGTYCSGQVLCERFGVTRSAVWKAIAKLREEGCVIDARPNRGYLLREEGDLMDGRALSEALKDNSFLKEILFFRTIDSTNLEVKRRAEKGEEGPLLIVADEQTAGRGRRGRAWSSPPGTDIFMSMLLRPKVHPENAAMITLVTALAVAGGIQAATGLRVQIKWPNDVVIGGKKTCGILTEMSTDLDEISYVVPGIGINVNSRVFPEEIAATATSLCLECGRTVHRVPVIAEFVRCFERYYGAFTETEDLSSLREVYESMLVNRDREVLVLDPKGSWRGTAEGITDKGELRVRRTDGTAVCVRSGEVSVRGIYGYV